MFQSELLLGIHSFYHHTSSHDQFCEARRFGLVASAISSMPYLKMAGATRPKRRASQN